MYEYMYTDYVTCANIMCDTNVVCVIIYIYIYIYIYD